MSGTDGPNHIAIRDALSLPIWRVVARTRSRRLTNTYYRTTFSPCIPNTEVEKIVVEISRRTPERFNLIIHLRHDVSSGELITYLRNHLDTQGKRLTDPVCLSRIRSDETMHHDLARLLTLTPEFMLAETKATIEEYAKNSHLQNARLLAAEVMSVPLSFGNCLRDDAKAQPEIPRGIVVPYARDTNSSAPAVLFDLEDAGSRSSSRISLRGT